MTKAVQYFIDEVVSGRNAAPFVWLLALLGAMELASLGATAWRNVLQRRIQEQAARDLMTEMFGQLRRLGFAHYERHPAGETLGLFQTEVLSAVRLFREYVPEILRYALTLLALLGLILHLSWQLSAWIVPFFLSYYLIGPYFEKRASLWAKEANKQRRQTNRGLYDVVSALQENRAYGTARWGVGRVVEQLRELHETMLRQYFHAYMRGTVRRVTTGLGAVAVFAYGIALVREGALSVGGFVAYSIFYFQVMRALTVIVTLMTEQRIVLQQAESLYAFMKSEPQVKEPEQPVFLPEVRGEIEFRNVRFGYPERPETVRGFSLRAAPGSKIALIGESGGGKSTILKLIARFYDPQEGEVLLDGVPLTRLSFVQLRSSIGYVFQETYLFGGTVRENIRFGQPDADDAAVEAAARAAYAHDFIARLPDGYDTIVGERGLKLSGGQKQRIAIARLFVKNPAIVLLDEATSALDNASEQEVQRALDSLLAGRTTIAVAHRLSTVRDFDRLVVFDEGRIAEEGTYDELLAGGERLNALLYGAGWRTAHE
ncbi:ABC transporter ATP-binding protein/permease [Paenibacillus sp. TRM 82003]|nr:ABC transporter ATP-binding protein/permease [Paenibacillus sp. TRM 82003]